MKDFLKSRKQSIHYALTGLSFVLKTQRNAWIHFGISLVVILAGIIFSISVFNWCLVFLAIGFVWSAECFNTAIESILDIVNPQMHPLAKIGKDAAAAGVLVAALTAVLVGLLVFGPPIYSLFFN